MNKLTIEDIKQNGFLVFEVISGSRAYGLHTDKSDTDIKGIYILPKEYFYSLEYPSQVSNSTNDIVYYELNRFIELSMKNNPNIIEMLGSPEDCVLQKHPIMDSLHPDLFLSKLCEQTFANYAYSQIRKATGLEKKIMNPVNKERKSVLDFCYVYDNGKSVLFKDYLLHKNITQESMGLAVIPHFRDSYNIFYSENKNYNGIIKTENSNDVSLSNIPKGEKPVGLLYFNKDGYSTYCKKYKEYWDWVENRNNERYKGNIAHGKNYDSKNMMHIFRLLNMAKEIAVEKKINVRRSDREFLLNIKNGKFEYAELVQKAEKIIDGLSELYANSGLQNVPNGEVINDLAVCMRDIYYQ